MKKILKIISLVLFVMWLFYCFWYYKRISYNNAVGAKNEAFIKKEVFGKDSENRGFSDEAKAFIDEDLRQVSNDQNVYKTYVAYAKAQRKLVLSKSKQEFTNNFINRRKISVCLHVIIYNKYSGTILKNYFDASKGEESKKMKLVIDTLSREFVQNNTVEENWNLLNSKPTKKECEDLIHE